MPIPPAPDVDAYIAAFPADVQSLLQDVRRSIRGAIPEAAEVIKYSIPTYVLKGNVISFGAYKHHIGVYPTPNGMEATHPELAQYRTDKATLRFPLGEPLPLGLIGEVARLRAEQLARKARSGARVENPAKGA